MSKVYKFAQTVQPTDGFVRGSFGGDLKKESFVPKSDTTYKVYEQGVVLEKDKKIGRYYIDEKYYKEKMFRFEVKEKDFLISCSGVNYGAIYQIVGEYEKGVINQALLIVRLNSDIVEESYFYYYYQAYIVKAITAGTGDSTIPNFPPLSVIKDIDIILPDICTQRKVGKVLKVLDDKIQLNNCIISELEQIAKTIYDYWFVQFDFPNAEGIPYRSSGGEMVWNEDVKREIPKGWDTGTLIDIANITMGQSPSGESYNNVGNGTVLYQGRTDFGYRFPTSRIYTTEPSGMANKGDVLLSVRAPVGDINIANETCCIGRGLADLNSKK